MHRLAPIGSAPVRTQDGSQGGSAVGNAYDNVEAEVRELVRRRGLDPIEDRTAMRRLVDEVVADYDERALTSSLPALSVRAVTRAIGAPVPDGRP